MAKRQPKPHFKKSHRAWYLNLNGKQVRLASEDEGYHKAMEVYYQVMAGRLPVDDNQSVAVLLHRYLASLENAPANTRRFYRKPIESFLAFIGPLRVLDVRPYHVDTWITTCYQFKRTSGGKLTDEETSSTYRHNLVRAVKTAFKWLEDQGYIGRSPIAGVKVPRQQARGLDAYIQPKTWEKVEQTAEGDLLDLLVVMRETGCRPQEVRRVEARHFDREGRRWVFPVEESKCGERTGKQRVVYLTDRAFEICLRSLLKHAEGPIFRNGEQPWTSTALSARCARLSDKLGVNITSYHIRHTYATDKIIAGVDLVTLATLMGHANLTMLQKVYQKVAARPDPLRKALGA